MTARQRVERLFTLSLTSIHTYYTSVLVIKLKEFYEFEVKHTNKKI